MGLILMAGSSLPHIEQLKLRKLGIEKSYWFEEPRVETIMGNKKWLDKSKRRESHESRVPNSTYKMPRASNPRTTQE